MKAKFKKIMAASLSAMMVMSMSVATDVQANGSIILNPITDGTALTGREFTAYQLFTVTQIEDNYKYGKVSSEVTTIVKTAMNEAIAKYNTKHEAEKLPELTGSEVKHLVNYLTGEKVKDNAEFHIELAKQLQKAEGLTTVKGSFDENGTGLKNENLEDGYYLVLETPQEGKPVSLAILQTVCGNDVNINVKSDTPTIDKIVGGQQDVNDYQIGETIPFVLDANAPSKGTLSHYDVYNFKMSDTLSDGLTLDQNSVKFEIGNQTDTITISEGKIKYDNEEIGTILETANSLIIDFNLKSTKFDTLFINDGELNTIKVSYNAVLNENAVIGNPESGLKNNNKVVLEYNNNPSNSTTMGKHEEDVNVYSYGLEVVKKDANDANKLLPGAKFQLYKDSENQDTLVKFTDKQKGDYIVAANGSVTEVVTDQDGKLNITGLDSGTYILKETVAPKGYNKLQNPIKIIINPEYSGKDLIGLTYTVSGGDGEASNTGDANQATGEVSVTVNNNSGLLLPSTGGMGTTILYIAGILAMAGGVCYFVMDKKKRAQK